MPSRPAPLCKVPQCGERMPCPKHGGTAAGRNAEQLQWERMLKRKAWQMRRIQYLLGHPACEDHLRLGGPATAAAEVHHVRRRARPEDATDDELVALCHEHHNLRTRSGA